MAMEERRIREIDPSEIVSRFEGMLKDPALSREIEIFVKTSGHISATELDRQFTC
jgi:hypothetical protein